MRTHPLPLSVLFAALLPACPKPEPKTDDTSKDTVEDSGWCYGQNPQSTEVSETFTVDAETFQGALSDDGTLTEEACEALCHGAHWEESLIVEIYECRDDGATESGEELIFCHYLQSAYCEGRAHEAVRKQTASAGPTLTAAWLARATHAEASSVGSFLALASELEHHNFSADMVERARAAARDEVAHARMMSAFSRRAGGRRQALEFKAPPRRTLEALATENAVEGCVGETWSALQAHWQSQAAPTPELRTLFRQIAADETRHAELARDLYKLAHARLSDKANKRVESARLAAFERLVASFDTDPVLVETLGLPHKEVAQDLAKRLSNTWTA